MARMRGGWRCLAVDTVKFGGNGEISESVTED